MRSARVRITAALTLMGAAVVIFTARSLPPPRLELPVPAAAGRHVRGVIHVHTQRSDGRGTADEIAAAAARAGLQFLIFTDHGDGTRTPDPPVYRSGVLCVDGVEISTTGGHYLAIDMPPAPYPLGGEARDVVDDVRRLGGFGIVAHPDSPKPELQWQEWDVPFDAIEILNPDTSWRTRAAAPAWRVRASLLGALLAYPIRPAETVASLLAPGAGVWDRWLRLIETRPVVGLAGVDAHARLALRDVDPGDNRFTLPFPGYEPLFRTLSVHVRPSRSFSGDATADAAALMDGIRGGRLFVSVDGIASPADVALRATFAGRTFAPGDRATGEGALRVDAATNATGFTTTIWEGGRPLGSGMGQVSADVPPGAAPIWMDVRAADRDPSPLWAFANPIYHGAPPAGTDAAPGSVSPEARRWLVDDAAIGAWSTEHDPGSTASLRITPLGGGPLLTLEYSLASPAVAMPFAALAVFTRGGILDGLDGVRFDARADRPMRLSVQLRAAAAPTVDDRWHRSVYLDTNERTYSLPFSDFRPIGGTSQARPVLADIHSIVFVVDTTNTRPGTSGRVDFQRVGIN